MDKERNKDKKKIDSEDDRSSVGSVNGKITILNRDRNQLIF